MDKEQIQKLESTKNETPWNKINSQESELLFEIAFEDVFNHLQENPGLYYVTAGKGFAEVHKRSDDSLVYHTDEIEEAAQILSVGLEK